jgi:Flp pilus assembly protein TadG
MKVIKRVPKGVRGFLNPPTFSSLVRSDQGAVAIMFALSGSFLIGSLCTAIDMISYEMTQTRLQSALDVATLSAGADLSHYNSTTGANLAQWQADAKAYFSANMPTSYFSFALSAPNFSATVDGTPATGQTIHLSATGSMSLIAPIFFNTSQTAGGTGSSQPSSTTTVSASNTAIRQTESTIELVMVLDNTGSMADPANGSSFGTSKMAGLQAAANDLVSIVLSQSKGPTVIGIVPFASTVNVTNALPRGGSWLSPSFAYNPTGVSMSSWGGCPVEPRDGNGYLSAQAYSPKSTLKFTPYYFNTPPGGLQVRSYKSLAGSFNNKGILDCGNPVSTSLINGMPLSIDSSGSINYCGFTSTTYGTGLGTYLDRTNSSWFSTTSYDQNQDCIANPVTFLTSDSTTLTNAIKKMSPSGSTIIPTGLLWGWRMLSSKWSEDLAPQSGWISTDTSLPKLETTQNLQRVMIVMTDGENQIGARGSFPNDLYFNGLSGVGTNSLAAPSVVRTDGTTLLNGLTDSSELHNGNASDPSTSNGAGYPDDVNSFQSATCAAIKQDGVIVYSITFGSAASSTVAEQVMKGCATPGDYAHAPTNAALDSIFQSIAGQLTALRLTQ